MVERRDSRKFLSARYWSCCVLINCLIIGGFSLVLFKSFRLQVLEYSTWTERARAQAQTILEVPAYRGSIYDCKGRLLSYSVPQKSLYADGDQIEDRKQTSAQLSGILGEPEAALEKKLTRSRHFVWIKRQLTDQQANAVEGLKRRGLNLTDEYKRFYPYRQVGGQVVGFVGVDGAGLEGIEKSFDQILRENTTAVGQMRDGVRRCLWVGCSMPPEPGESYGVRLTMDAFIQYISELELESAVTKWHARAGEVVVSDAQTSEVLAMANWPYFDPNLADKRNPDSWRNRAITDSFEPGSTFKVFVVSAALQEGIAREKDKINCEGGRFNFAGHTINDTHSHGWLTVPEVVKVSSNIGAAKLALQMGNERYSRYIHMFGFGAPTGISLPGEVKGLVRPHKRWRPIDLAVTGFGQSIGVTALQLNTAVGVIAKGGEFAEPIIAAEVVDAQGQPVNRFKSIPIRRVIEKQTADRMCAIMQLVTQEGGTGTLSVPAGYKVAGKTGTAQVLDPATHRYALHKYTSVFTGFVPADNPRLVITVVIHEPQGNNYGGIVAAPVFKGIASRVLPYLGVMPAIDTTPAAKGLRMAATDAGNAPKATRKTDDGRKQTVQAADAGKKQAAPAVDGGRKPAGTAVAQAKKTEPDRVSKAMASPVNGAKIQAKPPVAQTAGMDRYSLKTEDRGTGLYSGIP